MLMANMIAEVREYMYEVLLYLVSIHSHVTVVAKELLERTMNALVEDLASEAMTCFQQVKKFGMGGMLRVWFRYSYSGHTYQLITDDWVGRRHWKSSLCIRHWCNTSRPLPARLLRPYTAPYPPRIRESQQGISRRTCSESWTGSRRHCMRVGGRLQSSSCVSSPPRTIV